MTEVFPNIYIETNYWNAKNTNGTIFLNYNDSRPINIISRADFYEIKMSNTETTWAEYDRLYNQTTEILKKHLREKKTIQIIGSNYDDVLSIVAALLINISTTGLKDILQYLHGIVNIHINENSNAMQALLIYRFSIMVEQSNRMMNDTKY